MTRSFKDQAYCPHCGRWHAAESAFNQWMRAHPELRSQDGIVRFDCDVLLHRYMLNLTDGLGSRDVQCLMFIEVKTHDADLRPDQRDTLSLLSQVLRNRRRNVHAARRGLHASKHVAPCRAKSRKSGRNIALRLFGGHLLQLSADSPANSNLIRWDGNQITQAQLVGLLRFDLDPDKLIPMDWRRRYMSTAILDNKFECNECDLILSEKFVHCPICDAHRSKDSPCACGMRL